MSEAGSTLSPAPDAGGADNPSDLLIVGGGPVGMATALAAARLGLSVTLLDAARAGAWRGDPRAIALSEGSRQFLLRLGAWPIPGATAIHEVEVSQAGGEQRTRIAAADHRLDRLGEVIPYGALCDALSQAMTGFGPAIAVQGESRAEGFADEGPNPLAIVGKQKFAGRLLVHAEGAATAESLFVDYRQDALLAVVTPTLPHRHVAHERFTADGPVALLPQGRDFAVVYVVPRGASSDLEQDDPGFLAALSQRFAGRLAFAATGPRQRVPLALRVRPLIAEGRQLWLGNAAQSLHPISGQGLNLGLRDAACFAEALSRHGSDDLARAAGDYCRARTVDRLVTIGFTDLLARGFANDIAPIAQLRGAALSALTLFAPARRLLGGHMIFGHRL